jgi:4-oxalmesaconate hydratase
VARAQKAAFKAGEAAPPYPEISDDEIRETIEEPAAPPQGARRGHDDLLAARLGDGAACRRSAWQAVGAQCNDLIARWWLYPETFAGVCMLPQSQEGRHDQLDRRAGALRQRARLHRLQSQSRRERRPFQAAAADRQILVSFLREDGRAGRAGDDPRLGQLQPALHATGAYYIAADTIAFMQLIEGDLFKDFPTLRFIIPHGGGAVPYHWGRYRGLADMLKQPSLDTHLMNNVFFDTCVYHQPGIDLLAEVIETKNILFGSEMVGAVRGIDPRPASISTTPSAMSMRCRSATRSAMPSSRAMRAASSRASTPS